MEKGSVVIIKKFIEAGDGAKKAGMTEMQEFWKACTEVEKLQFTNEALKLMPQLAA